MTSMVCRILIICLVVGGVVSDYQLDVKVNFYDSFSNSCAQGCRGEFDFLVCCDNHNNTGRCTGEELCDTFFSFCLRSLGESTPDCPNNHTSANYTETTIVDTDTLVYEELQDLFGPTPLRFTGPRWTDIQFYIESDDDDSDLGLGAQLIDAFWVDLSNRIVGGERLKSSYYDGYFELAFIELSFEVVCTDSFSLPDCTPCEPHPSDNEDCINRQQVFHEIPGDFPAPETVEDLLGTPEPDAVTAPPFFVTFPESDVCSGQRCSDRGRCEESLISYYCDCWPGYTGRDCETVISDGGAVVATEPVTTDVGLVLNGTVGGLLVLMLVVVIALLGAILVVLRRQGRTKKLATEGQSTTNTIPAAAAGYPNSFVGTENGPKPV